MKRSPVVLTYVNLNLKSYLTTKMQEKCEENSRRDANKVIGSKVNYRTDVLPTTPSCHPYITEMHTFIIKVN